MTTMIATFISLAITAIPAAIIGASDIASWFAVSTIAVGAFIASWETVRSLNRDNH